MQIDLFVLDRAPQPLHEDVVAPAHADSDLVTIEHRDEVCRGKPDYAKWMLDDPRVNFAISMNRQPVGVNHLGFQVESDEELRGMRAQLEAADARMVERTNSPVAMPSRTSTGLPIPLESHGRPSIRWVASRSLTAICPASAKRGWSITSTMAWRGVYFRLVFAAAGMSLAQIGALSAIYPAVWGMTQIFTGALSDRIGRKQLIAWGMWT